MRRRRRSLPPRMLSLAVLYGLALRWPWPLQPGDYLTIRELDVGVLSPDSTRYFYLPLNPSAPTT